MSETLTHTEQKMVAYSLLGYTREEIAKAEIRSQHTVRRHFENIFRKLEIRSKSELHRWYVENILHVDLTNLKRRIGAGMLIVLMLFAEYNFSLDLRRPVRTRVERTSRGRGRRSKRDNEFLFDFEPVEIEEV